VSNQTRQPRILTNITVNGETFHCRCGANLFNECPPVRGMEIYSCNGCKAAYKTGQVSND
jgi:hypothetical protein